MRLCLALAVLACLAVLVQPAAALNPVAARFLQRTDAAVPLVLTEEPAEMATDEDAPMPMPAQEDVPETDAEEEADTDANFDDSENLDAVSVCAQRGGTCKSTGSGCSGGSFATGLCPGAANIKCCLVANTACSARGGSCRHTSVGCSGSFASGLCPGETNIKCCLPGGGGGGSCGAYSGAPTQSILGNGNKKYTVVKILRAHLSQPSSYDKSPNDSDNTMLVSTACAFDRMRNAAKAAGVTLTINSGFRTYARQQYFWHCYQTKSCNNGNIAAYPGTSNHGIGLALDINIPNYAWMKAHAHSFGFVRTVRSETWHWEHRPGTPPAPYT